MHVQLAGETDFAGFRTQARALLARGIAPEDLHWSTSPASLDLLADACVPVDVAAAHPLAHVAVDAAVHVHPDASASMDARTPPDALRDVAPKTRVPAAFIALCERAALHADPRRFDLLYRLLWRLTREPGLRHDPLDGDMILARRMAQAVAHEMHKMRAFVRFRQMAEPAAPGGVLHVAWFEPEHHVVEANADWFRRRFANMHWALLTPKCCVSWDGARLVFRPGASRTRAPQPDAGEALWLTYYRSIFNPARVKLATMQREMPRRYWRNLPEATLIRPLADAAVERAGAMLLQPAQLPSRRIPIHAAAQRDAPACREDSLDALRVRVQQCNACPIGANATQAVAGEGPASPALMIVGEQPGDFEDLAGKPFVGPAGQLLSQALVQAGIARDSVYLTNAVRHFKFELRGRRRIHKTPTQAEAAACAHWLEDEIALVGPAGLVALGATAARSLLGRPVAVMSERGRWHARPDGRGVFVTVHPSALLRMAPDERAAQFAAFVDDLRVAARG